MATGATIERGCPERQTLLRFAVGGLSDTHLSEIGEHLSSCETCLDQLAILQDAAKDDIDARLRDALQPTNLDDAVRPSATHSLSSAVVDTRMTWSMPHIGATVGRYRIREILGSGGMGVVYRAEQEALKKPVALKTIWEHLSEKPDRRLRFRNEVQALSRLDHPNIVRIFHFDEHDGWPYFTMELVEGTNLARLIDEGPLDFPRVAKIVRGIALAIANAHSQDVIHRDLKPQNVLLGTDDQPKVGDFGLARILGEEVSLTATGTTIGTPSYMSPEQAGGARVIGRASDIHAIGAVLYACLTSKPPFSASDPLAVLLKVRTETPTPPRMLRPEIPKDLEAIALRCLEKNPSQRYQSADEVAKELDRWLAGERTIAGRQARARRVKSWFRRHLRTAAAILALAAIVGIGARWSLTPAPPARRATLPPTQGDNSTIQEMLGKLAKEKSATLLGEIGSPPWYRQLVGLNQGKIFRGDDEIFTVTAAKTSMIELLPDSFSGSYRLTAQVRHSRSDRGGRVGIYAARQEYPVPDHPPIFTFCQLSYNDVRKPLNNPIHLTVDRKGGPKRELIDPDDVPKLSVLNLSDPEYPPDVGTDCSWSAGPAHPPLGEESGTWRDLLLIIEPHQVTASWDHQPPHTISVKEITPRITSIFEPVRSHKLFANFPAVQAFQPRYVPRGGCGLVVTRATASFRNVVLTPIPSE